MTIMTQDRGYIAVGLAFAAIGGAIIGSFITVALLHISGCLHGIAP